MLIEFSSINAGSIKRAVNVISEVVGIGVIEAHGTWNTMCAALIDVTLRQLSLTRPDQLQRQASDGVLSALARMDIVRRLTSSWSFVQCRR